MKTRRYIFCLLLVIGFVGCKDKILYNLVTNNHSEEKLYECKIRELYEHAVWGGSNPGTGGGTLGITVPVPDKLTITWKTVRPEKEKEAESHEKKIDMLLDDYFKKSEMDASFPYPKYVSFPQDLYEDHKVQIILKGKVPKRPKNGEIIITYMGNENFDVQYIEKKQEKLGKN